MTLNDVIDAEVGRGMLRTTEVYLTGVKAHQGIFHSEWCWIRRLGFRDEMPAVVMWIDESPKVIHVMGTAKLLCKLTDLGQHHLEFACWLEDA